MSFMGNEKKAGSTARAKAAADRRARVEKEMAKEAAMIEAMERKLRGGGGGVGVATTKEEQRNETPESNSSEVEGEAWLPRGDHENETEVEVDDEEDDEVGGGGDGSLGFLKDFDYSAEATRIAAMEAQLRQLRNGGREAIESGDEEVEEEEEEEGGEGSEGSGSDNENLNNEVVEEEDGGRNNDVGDNNEDLPFDLSTYLTGQSQPRKGGAQQQGWNGSNDDEDIRDAAQARSLHSLQGGSPSADMLHASSNTPPTGEADRGNNGRNARASSGRQYSRTNGAAADSSYNRGTPSPRFTSKKSDDENEEEEEEDDDGVEEDEQREEERAALAIQTAARGRVGRQRVAIRRRRHDEKNAQNAAAIRIQTAERSRRSSVQVQRKRQQQQQQSQKEHATKHNWHNDEYGIDRGDRRAPSPLRAAAAAAVVVPLLDLSASDVTAWLNASGLNAVATALAANGIDGATLSDPDLSEGDFQEVGVPLRLHRARLLSLVRSAQTNGVACTSKSSHSPSHRRHQRDQHNQQLRSSNSTKHSHEGQSAVDEKENVEVNASIEYPDDFEDVGGPANQLRLLAAFD